MSPSLPLTIHVIGRSGSGKTTTIEYLTTHLKNLGLGVGVIKHVHHEGFTFDAEGKDAWRHARAGASVVIGIAPHELALFKPTQNEAPLDEAIETLHSENLDLILVEGFSRAPSTRRSPKILTAKNERELKEILKLNKPPIIAITGPFAASKKPARLPKVSAPILNLQTDNGRLLAIIRKLLRPKEIEELYRKAAVKHGSECVGLAIGIRAAYMASNILGTVEAGPKVTYGTKECVAEAFGTIFPRVRIVPHGQNDDIRVENSTSKLTIQLAPKRHFHSSREALRTPDETLFRSINLNPK
jgi:molybdopterin-guanine dinucleotide biosynthesis protein MobB